MSDDYVARGKAMLRTIEWAMAMGITGAVPDSAVAAVLGGLVAEAEKWSANFDQAMADWAEEDECALAESSRLADENARLNGAIESVRALMLKWEAVTPQGGEEGNDQRLWDARLVLGLLDVGQRRFGDEPQCLAEDKP